MCDFHTDGEKYERDEGLELEVRWWPISFIFFFVLIFQIIWDLGREDNFTLKLGFRNWITLTRLCTLYLHLLTETLYVSAFIILPQLPISMLGKAGAGDVDFMLLISIDDTKFMQWKKNRFWKMTLLFGYVWKMFFICFSLTELMSAIWLFTR